MKELIKKQYEECRKAYEGLSDKTSAAALQLLGAMGAYENLCPELKESDSEKIRKAIIQFFELQDDNTTYSFIPKKDILAWLEKQCEKDEEILVLKDNIESLHAAIKAMKETHKVELEKQGKQKPTDKVEPNFHEGDWVVTDKNNVVQIKAIEDGKYVLENRMRFTVDYVDKCWRKWTIQDAKDGDVLADNVGVILFRKIGNEKYANVVDYYCVVDTSGKFEIQEKDSYWGETNDVLQLHPATKEQYDTLMKAMTDAGYTFDFEKKELKKIEQKPAEWSDDDEKRMNHIIQFLEDKDRWKDSERAFPIKEDIMWLKDLKPQNR